MRPFVLALALVGGLVFASPGEAQVVRVEILSKEPANGGQPAGKAGPFEILRGQVHGEVDPRLPQNRIIQDLELAPRNARGNVEYVATFALAKPVNPAAASGVLVYQVVNRGNGTVTPSPDGDISLVSGWQGDVAPTAVNQTIVVPVAKNRDGSPITGPVIARFYNIAPSTSTVLIRLSSMGGGPPAYPPASLDQQMATLTMHTSETSTGVQTGSAIVPRQAWAFADCRTTPFPGVPDATRLCLKDGFEPGKLYELVYTAKDPLILGIGLAATRDINAFFRYAARDQTGTANPVAGLVKHTISVGDSQSGNFIKTFIHLGFNEDLSRRIVWDGVFPRIAARQTPINFRFALPGGAATLYEPGSEPVVWWGRYEDKTRGRPPASLLDRCTVTKTCPKVIEAFGSTEFWGLRMSPGLIGTDAIRDIPLPDNVRRYYYPGTTHGGGGGGFRIDAPPGGQGGCDLAGNPNPEADTTRALTRALIEWVVAGTPPPESRYPRLGRGELVPATKADLHFPDLPGLAFKESPVNPTLDYDFGREFVASDLSGVISLEPPRIRQVIPTYVPVVNADGNETSGVPSVLHQAALGTYLGWNLTASGFFAGQGCGFTGGYLPFAKTEAIRRETQDPRQSVEERYGTLEGYVCVVQQAASQAVHDRFLLQGDADRLVAAARSSTVLPADADSSPPDRQIARGLCARPSR
ncbi:MAG TPA: alpha/beta hydrolase domain-containing protein [Vicinamibacterales bacterium]|nr:alpha/beta hydrolase domain-containing protein [Vicinamibacterales bacterium]